MFRRGFTQFAALASVAALAVSACGGAGATTAPAGASTAPGSSPSSGVVVTPASTAGGGTIVNGHILINWFVGLGSGTNPQQIALQQSVVNDFNAAQDKTPTGKGGLPIMLSMTIVQNNTATDILKTNLAAGNAPDVVGPVGIKGRVGFEGIWADITPLAKASGFDLTAYDPNLLKQLSTNGVLDGFPYAVYPSFIFFNKDLFDEAKLAYPPQKVGDKYKMPDGTMVDWTWDTVKTIAKLLSVDKNGKDASQAGFDPANQTQYGFEFQWTEGRRLASTFGSGNFVAADGKTAAFPDPWKAAWTWYYNGIWTDHFIANNAERNSDLLNKGNVVSSGHVAMGGVLQWYTCCLSPDATKVNTGFKKWDIAIMPSYNGVITAPMDLDVFGITKSSKDQQDAFTALSYIASRGDLAALYGGVPLVGDQLTFYHKYVDKMLAPQFPGNVVNWQVAIDMEKLAPAIHHEAAFPNYIKGMGDYTKVFTTLDTTAGLDMNKVFTDVTTALQTDFNTAP